ncbi:MAG: sn-glycerol-3-phosphate ABC transporter ATP-binding protein UgpC [Syntrophomonadaceae bacterium]
MAKVVLRNLSKYYREQAAVVDFNLEIKDREFLVIVGPSGCGKTTVLRLIAGLEEINTGDIFIGDVQVNDLPPRDRNIAMVFQNYALYPNMNVYDNLAFGLKMHNVGKAVIKEKVEAVAQMLNIENYLGRRPAQLSGGERQRVAIGRALVRDPSVFLMDEPLSNLDARLRNSMRSEIMRLHRRIQTTFIYVTHDQMEAMTLGERIVVMKKGYIQQVGTPEEIYNLPVNQFVAEFIGTPPMNFLPAMLKRSGGRLVAQLEGLPYNLSLKPDIPLEAGKGHGKNAIVGIRPEHISLDKKAGGVNVLTAKLDMIEKMGAEKHLHLMLGEVPIIAKTNGDYSVSAEGRVDIYLPPDYIHIFDGDTGLNVGCSLALNRRHEGGD